MCKLSALYAASKIAIAESISNASGLGFNGYDEYGLAKWDLVKTMDPLSLEFGTNVRQQVQAWNVQTATWLRRCQQFLFSIFYLYIDVYMKELQLHLRCLLGWYQLLGMGYIPATTYASLLLELPLSLLEKLVDDNKHEY